MLAHGLEADDRRAKKFLIRVLIALVAVLSIGMLGLRVPAPVAHANTITVTNNNDSGPGSLRQAIADAQDGDVIRFAAGVDAITVASTLIITKSIKIDGFGYTGIRSNVSIDGQDAVRVFDIAAGNDVYMLHVDVQHGNAGSGDGGGIRVAGHLTLHLCKVHHNSAANGGAVYVAPNGALIVGISDFNDNDATSGQGGAIFNDGVIFINDAARFKGNRAYASAGAIVNDVAGNASFGGTLLGGGLSPASTLAPASPAATTITPTIFSGNSVTSTFGYGGAIVNLGVMTLTNVAFFTNTGQLAGGAIYNASGGSITATLLTVISNISTSNGARHVQHHGASGRR